MIKVSEIFPSFQMEGQTIGKNVLFVRVTGCNLKCRWCDSKYSWKDGKYVTLYEINKQMIENKCQGIVFSGGSPLLYNDKISEFLKKYKPKHCEIETNGVIHPDKYLSSNKTVNFNVSPKLENSGNSKEKRYNKETLSFYAKHPKAIFKFVIQNKDDLVEVEEIIKDCHIPKEKVYLMAEGATKKQQELKMKDTIKLAMEKGWNFSPRVQVLIYGNKRGV